MATGTATIDFGAFPGKSDTLLVVTGQAAIVAGSLVEAWLRPVSTADHTDTEHMLETMSVFAADIVAGVGFTIYAFNTSQLNEPVGDEPPTGRNVHGSQNPGGSTDWVALVPPQPGTVGGGIGTRIYGTWTVAWAWV